MSSDITPYTLHVPDEAIADLRSRLRETRWPSEDPGYGWEGGVPLAYAKELVTYWEQEFDWRAQEARINAWPSFLARINDADIHFIHARSGQPEAIPLLLIHGWPGAPTEFLPLIDTLTSTREGHSFDLVIPTIPGFGIPGPVVGWDVGRAAKAFTELMAALGYRRYMVHGYDTGAAIAREMTLIDAEKIAGIHVTQVLGGETLNHETADFSDPIETKAVEQAMRYEFELSGYAVVQSTRPQSLSYALTDSPVGQLAWLVERFFDWSAAATHPEDVFTRDDMLTTISLYWFFKTAGSSARYYKEDSTTWGEQPAPSRVPMAILSLPDDIGSPVRRLIEANNNIVRWTDAESGGHFAAWEQPDLVANDLRQAATDLWG